MLTLLNNCLIGLLEKISFHKNVLGTTFDSLLAYLAFPRFLEVDWKRIYPAMEEELFQNDWNILEAFSFAEQRVHEQTRDAGGKTIKDEGLLPPVVVKYKMGI